MIGQDAVLTHHGNDVTRNADGTQVEQRDKLTEGYAIAHGKSLHQLKAHPTS